MATTQKSIRLRNDLLEQVDVLAQQSHMTLGGMVNHLLDEAIKMRRVPGIVFLDGPAGRRPCVEGSGLEVWEIIAQSRATPSEARLARHFNLDRRQVRSALAYYQLYPHEIDQAIAENAAWTRERLAEEAPQLFRGRR